MSTVTVHACVAVVLLAQPLLMLPSSAALAQTSTGAEGRSVQRGSSPKRGAARGVQSNSKASKRGKQNTKRGDQDSQAAGGQEASEIETRPEPSRVQEAGRGRRQGARTEVDSVGAAEGVNKGIDQSAATDGVKGKLESIGDTGGGNKITDQANLPAGARYSRRMEFDARLVYGETAGSGAVILFERGQRQLPPLTKQRTKFLSATLESVLGRGAESYPDKPRDSKEVEPDKTVTRSTSNGSRD